MLLISMSPALCYLYLCSHVTYISVPYLDVLYLYFTYIYAIYIYVPLSMQLISMFPKRCDHYLHSP